MKLASIIQGTATVLLGVKLRRGKNFDPCLKGCEALNGSQLLPLANIEITLTKRVGWDGVSDSLG